MMKYYCLIGGFILFTFGTVNNAAPTTTDHCQPQKFVVAIDIGHTHKSPGATSARGRPEFEFNLALAKQLLTGLLHAEFEKSFLINESGTIPSLKARTRKAKEAGASLFVSIHHDSVQPKYLSKWQVNGKTRRYSDKFHGYSLFISKRNPAYQASLFFATMLGQELTELGLTPTLHHAEPIRGENRPLLDSDLGIYRFDNLVVLRTATMPAVLFEAGIIVNREEEEQLMLPSYRAQLVRAVVRSIVLYCKSRALVF